MVAPQPARLGQLSINLPVSTPEETVLNILRNEYLRNNGDLSAFVAELALRQPKPQDPSELWSHAGRVLSKSHR
jgi:hypothetical protein